MADLFENIEPLRLSRESVAAGAVLLRGNALAFEDALLEALGKVAAQAPFRHMVTPGGFSMSVAMTNCGAVGWVTDRTGYRYDRVDPESGRPWPALPEVFCMMGGMGGMMGGGQVPNLKKLYSAQRVQTITHCKDTYTVTTANGQSRKFWERNLRLKTDASNDGPEKNAPALVDAGMMGDRADVIFADPGEISPFIAAKC